MWEYTGQKRPPFAAQPSPGQESVWDYPRPPALVSCDRLVEIRQGSVEIARTNNAFRLLETASPPTFYLSPEDVIWEYLVAIAGQSICEWKGSATYFALTAEPATPVAWSYPEPTEQFAKLKDFVAFYPGRIACFVNGERVRAQPGQFYGGWITADVVGPFKGEPGSGNW